MNLEQFFFQRSSANAFIVLIKNANCKDERERILAQMEHDLSLGTFMYMSVYLSVR